MAVSRSTDIPHERSWWHRLTEQLSRYDLVLTAIPVIFSLVSVWYVLSPVSFHSAVAIGAIVCCFLLADALFLNPTTQSSPDR